MASPHSKPGPARRGRRFRRPLAVLLACLVLLPFLQLAGCASPAWYSQAIGGHLELMRSREDINELLASGELEPEQAEKLALAVSIREFASAELGLPDNDSYTELTVTGREAVTWNVVAAEEFSVTPRQWCFLVSGCVPYRGYFNREKADAFASKLRSKGLETDVSPAIAYSTLGWFDDPLLDTMLVYGDEQLAAYLFHELAHQQLYVKNDTAFNEAYAGFVEQIGVQKWLAYRGESENLQAWKDAEQASLDFNRLLSEGRQALAELYASGQSEAIMRSEKSRIFAGLKADYQELVNNAWDGRDFFGNWFNRELNNARLALMSSYQGGSCAFQQIYEEAEMDLPRFYRLAEEKSKLPAEQRSQWLNSGCEGIAPKARI